MQNFIIYTIQPSPSTTRPSSERSTFVPIQRQRHPLTSLTHPPSQPIKHVETAMARPNQQRTALLRPLQCVDVLRSTVHIDAREWQEASRGEFQFKYYSVVIANHRMCGHNFARQ